METKEDKTKGLKTKIKLVQALCLGIFTLGLSMMVGDISGYAQLPISTFSLTTTIFGGMGAILCEIFSRQVEKW